METTYDIHFACIDMTDHLGLVETYEYCEQYILQHNSKANENIFLKYKGCMVGIICNETDQVEFVTLVQ